MVSTSGIHSAKPVMRLWKMQHCNFRPCIFCQECPACMQGFHPLHVTVRCVKHLPIVKVLMEHGANQWTTDHQVTCHVSYDSSKHSLHMQKVKGMQTVWETVRTSSLWSDCALQFDGADCFAFTQKHFRVHIEHHVTRGLTCREKAQYT